VIEEHQQRFPSHVNKKKMTRLDGWAMAKDATLGGRGNCPPAAI
jgi:hypothetical protein